MFSRDIAGLVLGQRYEPAALVTVRRQEALGEFAPKRARWLVDTSYEVIRATRWFRTQTGPILEVLPQNAVLLVDISTCGWPVVEAIAARGLRPIPARLDDGTAARAGASAGQLRLPKRDLVATLGLLMSERRLKAQKGLEHADVLAAQMKDFRVDGERDELVRAVALACWWGEHRMFDRHPQPPAPRVAPEMPRPPSFDEACQQHEQGRAKKSRI